MKRYLLLILAVLLTACAQVPTSGPIMEVDQPVTDVATTSFVRVLARPPQPGMTPTEIVQGFLDAASGFEDNHAVAKQYLTEQGARQWNPSAGVRVYGNDTEALTTPADDTVTLTAAQVGLISSRSQYLQSPPDSTLSVQFDLVRVGPDWRISQAPQGLLLSRAAVERSYREYDTYFVADPGGILAPDPVLFASSQRDVTADLVRALLAGPSRWLAPSVSSAFPEGTRLLSVSVTDGVARVDFTTQLLAADDAAREELSAQLVWTLRQIAGLRAVEITADGQPFEVPEVPSPQPRTAWAEYDPDGLSSDATYYLVRSGRVLTLDAANAAVPVNGPAGSGDPPVRDPLMSLDETAIAATDEGAGCSRRLSRPAPAGGTVRWPARAAVPGIAPACCGWRLPAGSRWSTCSVCVPSPANSQASPACRSPATAPVRWSSPTACRTSCASIGPGTVLPWSPPASSPRGRSEPSPGHQP